MRNRAKCKLCKKVIESFHATDYVECECGEISVDEGTSLRCSAKNWSNFLRIDENDNEILVSVRTDPSNFPKEEVDKKGRPDKKELIDALDSLIKTYENLPEHARFSAVTHEDLTAALFLISAIIKE